MRRKYEYRRYLPHYQKDNRILFITYSTWHRWRLPGVARVLALESCLRANGRKYQLYAAVVMPDHVHLICMPLADENGSISIPEITRTIKSESAHRINKALGRTGRVWQDESFDHVLRGDESLRKKAEYILENPVRAGLVMRPDDYPWLWWDKDLIESVARKPRGRVARAHTSCLLPHLLPHGSPAPYTVCYSAPVSSNLIIYEIH